jgi:hypothetical protein
VPAATAQPVPNSTQLRAEPIHSPQSQTALAFVAPDLGEHLLLAEPRSYRIRLSGEALGPDVVALEVSLDAERPRRLSLAEPSITLGELSSEDSALAPGSHWLFAAPVQASGLVPRARSGGRSVAKARRFFIGQSADEAAGPSGAVWLRKPDGSYNGAKNADSLLFDAFVFSALGEPLDAPSTITLRSPQVSGQLQLPSPFLVHEVPSGVYEVSVSAASASTRTTHFTVNRELGGGS